MATRKIEKKKKASSFNEFYSVISNIILKIKLKDRQNLNIDSEII